MSFIVLYSPYCECSTGRQDAEEVSAAVAVPSSASRTQDTLNYLIPAFRRAMFLHVMVKQPYAALTPLLALLKNVNEAIPICHSQLIGKLSTMAAIDGASLFPGIVFSSWSIFKTVCPLGTSWSTFPNPKAFLNLASSLTLLSLSILCLFLRLALCCLIPANQDNPHHTSARFLWTDGSRRSFSLRR